MALLDTRNDGRLYIPSEDVQSAHATRFQDHARIVLTFKSGGTTEVFCDLLDARNLLDQLELLNP